MNQFLTHLAVKEHVSASTQNQALSRTAVPLSLRDRIAKSAIWARSSGRASRIRLPVVMTRDEVKAVIGQLTGDKWLMASAHVRQPGCA